MKQQNLERKNISRADIFIGSLAQFQSRVESRLSTEVARVR